MNLPLSFLPLSALHNRLPPQPSRPSAKAAPLPRKNMVAPLQITDSQPQQQQDPLPPSESPTTPSLTPPYSCDPTLTLPTDPLNTPAALPHEPPFSLLCSRQTPPSPLALLPSPLCQSLAQTQEVKTGPPDRAQQEGKGSSVSLASPLAFSMSPPLRAACFSTHSWYGLCVACRCFVSLFAVLDAISPSL